MPFEPVDYAFFVIAAVSAAIWGVWIVRHRKASLYAVPPLTWCADVFLFYATSPVHTIEVHVLWTAVISLHAAFLLMGISVAMLMEEVVIR